MISIKSFFLKAILILGIASAYGEEGCSDEAIEYANGNELFEQRISLAHAEGSGLGYAIGYSSAKLFLSQSFQRFTPFVDLRGHLFNNDRYAGNAALGVRYLDSCLGQIWGVNLAYDYLQHLQKYPHRSYHQVGGGIEWAGERWDFHLNAYAPVGRKKTNIYRFHYGFFEALKRGFLSDLKLGLKAREQAALNGIDMLLGYRFCNVWYTDLHISAGPYYYWGRTEKTTNAFAKKERSSWGGRFVLELLFQKYISLTGVTTYDSLFKWRGQGMIALNLPFDFCKGICFECAPSTLRDRLFDSIERNEIIAVDSVTRYTNNPRVLDPEYKP